MAKKIPMRKCIVTQKQYPKQELMRVVLTPEKEVVLDLTGKQNGRGAYLVKDKEIILKARASNLLSKALKYEIPDAIFDQLLEFVDG